MLLISFLVVGVIVGALAALWLSDGLYLLRVLDPREWRADRSVFGPMDVFEHLRQPDRLTCKDADKREGPPPPRRR